MTPDGLRQQVVYLDAGGVPVFGLLHLPADAAPDRSAVLLCPPWGWDEAASYRSRRAWAEHLARRGHPVLRIDYPGTGDSAGSPADEGLVDAWTSAVAAATRFLAGPEPGRGSGRDGRRHVAVLGLGVGGLLAAASLAKGAIIDELLLWATPRDGRRFVREQRAFGSLQATRYGAIGEPDAALPHGWLEIGGFVLSAATIAALESLTVAGIEAGGVRRALLIGRDGTEPEAALRDGLAGAGVEVTVAPGSSWEAMVFHPERYSPPTEVMRRVDDWLGPGGAAPDGAAAAAPDGAAPVDRGDDVLGDATTATEVATIQLAGGALRERPLSAPDGSEAFFGILTDPIEPAGGGICAVFLNAGALRRTGPNRMWVDAARRWAVAGVPSFRSDVVGIGDAAGDGGMYRDVGRFYSPDREGRVVDILDALEASGYGPRFVLVGLCAGAFSGFKAAATDDRVAAAVCVNPRILEWDPGIIARRNAQLVNRVLRVDSWQRILSGQTTPRTVLAIGRAAAAEALRPALRLVSFGRRGATPQSWVERLEETLDRQRLRGARVVLAFSGDEPVLVELREEGTLDRLGRWPNVVLAELPGEDHTLRPVVAQRALHQLLDRELDLLLSALPAPAAG